MVRWLNMIRLFVTEVQVLWEAYFIEIKDCKGKIKNRKF